MSRSRFSCCILALLALLPTGTVRAQDSSASALRIGVGNSGLAVGNAHRWNGIRINWRDRDVEQVNGLNLTLWTPDSTGNERATVNGVSLGLTPAAGRLHGLNAGVAPVAVERLAGINLGLLALVSGGASRGISLAGLGHVAEGPMTGINAAGLGLVSGGPTGFLNVAGLGLVSERGVYGVSFGGLGLVSSAGAHGVSVAGLGLVAEGRVTGVALGGFGVVPRGGTLGLTAAGLAVVSGDAIRGATAAGLAVVTEGPIEGVSAAGLAVVGGGRVSGVTAAGLAVVAQGPIRGVTAAGLAIVNDDQVAGLAAALYRIRAELVRGVTVTGWLRTVDQRGLSIGAYNRVEGTQRGLAIGIYNSARELHGVQLGLLNRAENNKPPFRWLPLLNLHL